MLSMEAIDPRGAFPAPMELAATAQRAREAAGRRPGADAAVFARATGLPLRGWVRVRGARASHRELGRDRRDLGAATRIHDAGPAPGEVRPAAIADGIEAPPLPLMGDGLRLARADTLGELVLRIWLAAPGPGLAADPLLTPETAERAATGWRGNRVAIYVPAAADAPPAPSVPDAGTQAQVRTTAALGWLTAWESEGDADDFLQSVAPRLAALAAGGESESRFRSTRPSGPRSGASGPATRCSRSSGAERRSRCSSVPPRGRFLRSERCSTCCHRSVGSLAAPEADEAMITLGSRWQSTVIVGAQSCRFRDRARPLHSPTAARPGDS